MAKIRLITAFALFTILFTVNTGTATGEEEFLYYNEPISESEISRLISQDKTKNLIKQIIAEDSLMKYSELSGAVSILENEKVTRLDFIPIETLAQEISKKIIDSNNNIEKLRLIFLEYKYSFSEIYINAPNIFEKKYQIVLNRETGFEKILLEDASFFLIFSRSSGDISREKLIEAFEKKMINGKFIGIFHVHNDGSDPSYEDLESSKIIRGFVIAKLANGFKLFQLYEGKIFSTNLIIE